MNEVLIFTEALSKYKFADTGVNYHGGHLFVNDKLGVSALVFYYYPFSVVITDVVGSEIIHRGTPPTPELLKDLLEAIQ